MTLYLWVVLVVTFVFKVSNQCDHGEVRLRGGSGPHEGRVEVCMVSQWVRVCSDKWDNNDAKVVCRQLGYSPHGATTSGTEFGNGLGSMWLNIVQCHPRINKALLECDSTGTSHATCGNDAGVKCRDKQRVRNITTRIVNTSNTSSVHTVLVTWEQNLTVDEPSSFRVECHNEQYSIITTVSNENSNTILRGLLSSSYNCCVTAVYQLYESKEICTGINTTSSIMCTVNGVSSATTCNQELKGTKLAEVVGGVLGFITAVLIILLALSGIALLCLLRPELRKRLIPGRSTSTVERNLSTQHDASYSITPVTSHSTTSGTPTQATRANSGDKSTANYSSLGPTYQMIDSKGTAGRSRNQVLLSERYEFADIQGHADSSGGISTKGNVIPAQVIEQCHEEYAHLQH